MYGGKKRKPIRNGQSASAAALLASKVVENNYLLNPAHPDFSSVVIREPALTSPSPRASSKSATRALERTRPIRTRIQRLWGCIQLLKRIIFLLLPFCPGAMAGCLADSSSTYLAVPYIYGLSALTGGIYRIILVLTGGGSGAL